MVFLPLSAFFLQMQGEMDGDGGEPNGVMGVRRKRPKKGRGGPRKGRVSSARSPDGKAVDRTRAGSGDDVDAIGKDSVAEGKSSGKKPMEKPHKCAHCDDQATKAYVWAGHRAFIPTCKGHEKKTRHQIEVTNKDEVSVVKDLPQPVQPVQSSAQEAVTMTANVPTTPIPIGPVLRRVTPLGRSKRKKSKKKQSEWADRLVAMAESSG